MDSMTLIAIASIVTAGLTIALGSIGPALGEGRAVATALSSWPSSQTPPRQSHAPCLSAWR